MFQNRCFSLCFQHIFHWYLLGWCFICFTHNIQHQTEHTPIDITITSVAHLLTRLTHKQTYDLNRTSHIYTIYNNVINHFYRATQAWRLSPVCSGLQMSTQHINRVSNWSFNICWSPLRIIIKKNPHKFETIGTCCNDNDIFLTKRISEWCNFHT